MIKEGIHGQREDTQCQDISASCSSNQGWMTTLMLPRLLSNSSQRWRMLSHGAWATISELSISHSVRLGQVLLLSSEKVTLVFAHEYQAKLYREIQISDLPNLKEQGIHLHFDPFLKQMLKAEKYEHGNDRVPHQPPADFEVQSIATSFVGIDEGEERDSTVEGADCVGSSSDPGRILKLSICNRQ